jgi:hypothetical protein
LCDPLTQLGDGLRFGLGPQGVQDVLHRVCELPSASEALVRVEMGRGVERGGEPRMRFGHHLANARCLLGGDHRDELALRLGLAQTPPDEPLDERDAEREDVGSAIEGLTQGLLGRHVRQLALEHARLGLLAAEAGDARDAEVAQADAAVATEEDVRGADVTMHDTEVATVVVAHAVDGIECSRHLATHQGNRRRRHRPAFADDAVERGSVDVVEREVQPAIVGLAELDESHDVGVVEPRDDLSLGHEGLACEVAHALGGDEALDRDLPAEVARTLFDGQPDLSHGASAEHLQQAEFAGEEFLRGGLGHGGTAAGRQPPQCIAKLRRGPPKTRRSALGGRPRAMAQRATLAAESLLRVATCRYFLSGRFGLPQASVSALRGRALFGPAAAVGGAGVAGGAALGAATWLEVRAGAAGRRRGRASSGRT